MLSCVAFLWFDCAPLRHTPLTAHNPLLPLCQLDGARGGSSMVGSASSALFNS